ncbi:TetR/AcrR family transcriptional regulator [Aquimarina sp. AU58]|uniref:TetR/AcrR family transcriptional regulator n=1 Tax=Aquimarina sp. AU58 TaxID=1874112 RepID=UPI000D6E4DE5|nr:TetR/AcrR family transcriptional regulator [Aquimarina sp. AU58]
MKEKAKKEIFFEESLKLFYEKGFKATTMRDIARKMNFEVANIYNYIDSKSSLLEEYLFDISEKFHSSIDDIIASSYTPEEKLRLIISTHVRLTAKRPYEIALLVNEWRNLKEPKLNEFVTKRNIYEEKVKSVIKSGIEHNQFRIVNPDIITDLVLSTLRWLYDKYTDNNVKVNSVELEKEIADFIMSGLCIK